MDPALKEYLDRMEQRANTRSDEIVATQRGLSQQLEAQSAQLRELAEWRPDLEARRSKLQETVVDLHRASPPAATVDGGSAAARIADKPPAVAHDAPPVCIETVLPVTTTDVDPKAGVQELDALSVNTTESTPVSTPAAAPTSPSATVDVIPMLATAAASIGTLSGELIKGAASTRPWLEPVPPRPPDQWSLSPGAWPDSRPEASLNISHQSLQSLCKQYNHKRDTYSSCSGQGIAHNAKSQTADGIATSLTTPKLNTGNHVSAAPVNDTISFIASHPVPKGVGSESRSHKKVGANCMDKGNGSSNEISAKFFVRPPELDILCSIGSVLKVLWRNAATSFLLETSVRKVVLEQCENLRPIAQLFGNKSSSGMLELGPFIFFPDDCQGLAIACLYYFSNRLPDIIEPLASCCLSDKLEPLILFRIVDVLQSTYKTGNLQITEQLSFLSLLMARFDVNQDIPPGQVQMTIACSTWQLFLSGSSPILLKTTDTTTLYTLEWMDYSLAAKFSLFHQQILMGFHMASSTPDQLSVFAMTRSCSLELLPTLGVWRAVHYDLSSPLFTTIIDVPKCVMGTSILGRIWDPGGVLLGVPYLVSVSVQAPIPGGRPGMYALITATIKGTAIGLAQGGIDLAIDFALVSWDPGGFTHEPEKTRHWLEGKPVLKEGGMLASLGLGALLEAQPTDWPSPPTTKRHRLLRATKQAKEIILMRITNGGGDLSPIWLWTSP